MRAMSYVIVSGGLLLGLRRIVATIIPSHRHKVLFAFQVRLGCAWGLEIVKGLGVRY